MSFVTTVKKAMETKRTLRRRISEMESELFDLQRREYRSAVIERADLPKCENQMCWACQNAVIRDASYVGPILLGCGKQMECADFTTAQTIRILPPNSWREK